MRLDLAAARRALEPIAAALGGSIEAAALGVIRVANEHMARALRVISVQRGIDPRGFVLVSFGGAGGLHVCALAEALGMHRALVPLHAGVLSALGMLATRPGRQLSRTRLGLLAEQDGGTLEREFAALAGQGRAELAAEGVDPARVVAEYSLDLRYAGQSYTLEVPWQGLTASAEDFEARHQGRYGHRLGLPVELVNLRVLLRGPAAAFDLPALARGGAPMPYRHSPVHGLALPVPVVDRAELAAGAEMQGPALITETVATTWVEAGWRCQVDRVGNLRLERLQTG